MNDLLEERLATLARDVAVPNTPLDMARLRSLARRSRLRGRVVSTLVVALSATAAVLIVQVASHAAPRTTRGLASATTPFTPDEVTLQHLATQIIPGSIVRHAESFPAGYLAPGTSAFAGRSRTGRLTATIATTGDRGVHVTWDVLDRSLDPTEVGQFIAYALSQDPENNPPPPVLVHDEGAVSGTGVRVYRLVEQSGSVLVATSWNANGSNLVLQYPTVAVSSEASDTDLLVALAKAILQKG